MSTAYGNSQSDIRLVEKREITTTELIASTAAYDVGTVISTTGYTTAGDGGGRAWVKTATTGAVNQNPSQLSGPLLNTGLGDQWTVVGDTLSVEELGAIGDGIADDEDAIQAAFNDTSIKHVIMNNTYLFDKTAGGTALSLNNSVKVSGKGRLMIDIGSTFAGTGINLGATDCHISGIIIDVSTDVGGSVAIVGNTDISGLVLDGVEITGERSLTGGLYKAHGIKLADDCEAHNVRISGCHIHSCNFLMFTANAFGTSGNLAKDWTVVNNNFANCEGGFSYNSDFGTSAADTPWRGVTHSSNTHDNMRGSIGTDSCIDIVVSNNTFRNSNTGSVESAIHLENLGGTCAVTGNTISCIDGGGIKLYPLSADYSVTGNTITGGEGRLYTDAVSTFSDPDSTSVGILLVNDPDGSPQNVSVTGNTISNFMEGIHATSETDDMAVSGNMIALCSAGMFVKSGGGQGINSNSMTNCKYVYSVGNNRGIIGKNQAQDCGDMFFDLSDDVILSGITWTFSQSVNLVDGVTNSVVLFDNPVRADVVVNSVVRQTNMATDHTMSKIKMDIDNAAAITSTEDIFLGVGSLTVPATPFTKAAGSLEFNIFNGSGADQTAYLSVDFTGCMIWT